MTGYAETCSDSFKSCRGYPVRLLASFLLGALLVAVVVLTIHDQQTIATLKRYHSRLKTLEARR